MATKILFKQKNSVIIIKNGKLYVANPDGNGCSPLAISIMPGFQIELGRTLKELNKALSLTRIPIVIKLGQESPKVKFYQIIRMKTGIVDDKIVATLAVDIETDKIMSVTFNKELRNDKGYRRYNNLSIIHQLALPYNLNGNSSRSEQVKHYLKAVITSYNDVIKITENNKIIDASIQVSNKDTINIKFIYNRNKDVFELTTVTLIQ